MELRLDPSRSLGAKAWCSLRGYLGILVCAVEKSVQFAWISRYPRVCCGIFPRRFLKSPLHFKLTLSTLPCLVQGGQELVSSSKGLEQPGQGYKFRAVFSIECVASGLKRAERKGLFSFVFALELVL